MRTYAIIISLLFLLSLWLHFDNYQTADDNQKALQSEIISGKNKADSAHIELQVKKDSIQILTILIANKNEETERAMEAARKAQARNNKTKSQVAQVQPMIDSLAKKDTVIQILNVAYHNCDTLVNAQAEVIRSQGESLIAKDRMIDLSQNALQASEAESLHLRGALSASEELTREAAKNAKRKGFLRGIGLGGIAVVLVLLL